MATFTQSAHITLKEFQLNKAVYITIYSEINEDSVTYFSLCTVYCCKISLSKSVVGSLLCQCPPCPMGSWTLSWSVHLVLAILLIKSEFLHLNWTLQLETHKRLMPTTLLPHTNISLALTTMMGWVFKYSEHLLLNPFAAENLAVFSY